MRTLWSAALLVAMCLIPSVTADVSSYEGTWDLEVTELNTPLGRFGFGGNCVYISDAVHIGSGSATLTWVAQTPLTETLELVIYDWETGTHVARASGTSPFTVAFEDVALTGSEPGLLFSAQLAGAGAAAAQAVALDLTFDYTGGAVDPSVGGCALG